MTTQAQAQAPVLISGAGPTGLVLAITLRKNGIPVRIIDKAPIPQQGERGNGVSPRSLELHLLLGTAPKILKAAAPVPFVRVYSPEDGTTPLQTFPFVATREPSPHTPQSNYVMLGQNLHEQILREYLEELGTTVEHSTELQTFSQTESGVQATLIHHNNGDSTSESIQVPWLLGTDGAHSIVRKTLGLEFLGETKVDRKMLICDIKLKGSRREFIEQWGDRSSGIVFTRPSGHQDDVLWVLMAGPGFDLESMVNSRDKFLETFYKVSKRHDIEFGDLISSALYTPNIRMVKKMGLGRVFVLGDAAHCHTPAGGQGLNSSIKDAFNLAWKLSLVYHGTASTKLLDSFDEERLPVIAAMLDKTTELLEKNLKSSNELDVKRGTDFFQLGVNYRNSPIVLDSEPPKDLGLWPAYNQESETGALPGDRAPDAPSLLNLDEGSTTSIFGILSPIRHTILLFGTESKSPFFANFADAVKNLPSGITQVIRIIAQSDPTSNIGSDQSFDLTLRDVEGHASSGYKFDTSSQPLAVIIRPDGVIGARVADGDGLARYFKLILA